MQEGRARIQGRRGYSTVVKHPSRASVLPIHPLGERMTPGSLDGASWACVAGEVGGPLRALWG